MERDAAVAGPRFESNLTIVAGRGGDAAHQFDVRVTDEFGVPCGQRMERAVAESDAAITVVVRMIAARGESVFERCISAWSCPGTRRSWPARS
jgi:hypothetical protein